jgi:hypothetical protein
MYARILRTTLGAALLLAPLTFAQDNPKPSPAPPKIQKSPTTLGTADRQSGESSDMKAAIAWERYKETVAERWARKEAKNPSVTYNNANRTGDDADPSIKDPGSKRDK